MYFELRIFPASALILVWYVQFLSRSLKAHGSIVSYLSGVKTLHTLLNYNTDNFHSFLLKLTLRGLWRSNPHIVKKAKPITPQILRDIYTTLDFNDPADVIFGGICVLAFMLIFRKSNLIPNKINRFDPHRQLKHSDCVITNDRKRLIVGIRWAKNHQFTKELLTFPLSALDNSVLCPIRAVENIRKLKPYDEDDHIFQLPEGGSFTYRRFQSVLREKLKLIGEDAYAFSSHNFRRGATTFSFHCVVPLPMIKLLGNWTSDAFLSYLEFPIETCMAVCDLMKARLLAMEVRQNL